MGVEAFLPTLHQKLAVLGLALAGVAWIVYLVRGQRMREEHALLWLVLLVGGAILVWVDPLLVFVTTALGVDVPASALILVALFFLFVTSVWLTTEVSRQKQQLARLTILLSIEREERSEPES